MAKRLVILLRAGYRRLPPSKSGRSVIKDCALFLACARVNGDNSAGLTHCLAAGQPYKTEIWNHGPVPVFQESTQVLPLAPEQNLNLARS